MKPCPNDANNLTGAHSILRYDAKSNLASWLVLFNCFNTENIHMHTHICDYSGSDFDFVKYSLAEIRSSESYQVFLGTVKSAVFGFFVMSWANVKHNYLQRFSPPNSDSVIRLQCLVRTFWVCLYLQLPLWLSHFSAKCEQGQSVWYMCLILFFVVVCNLAL